MDMSHKVTVYDNCETTKGQSIAIPDFKGVSAWLSHCTYGGKQAVDFSNIDDTSLNANAFIRCTMVKGDRHLSGVRSSSNLILLDGDHGIDGDLCSPKEFHEHLVGLGINHCIYTSYSHNEDINKFRCVIPCDGEYTENNTIAHHKDVLKHVGNIAWVSEMGNFVQLWFLPRREKDDGLFEHYEYLEGKNWELKDLPDDVDTTIPKEERETSSSGRTIETMINAISSGENIHDNVRDLIYQYVKDGHHKGMSLPMIEHLVRNSERASQDPKYVQTVLNDLDRFWDGALKRKDQEETAFAMPKGEGVGDSGSELPKPPGLLGDLYDAAYDSLLYQYPEVALVSALGAVAGIVGRKFNVMKPQPTGLNLYMTIVAGTGFGKESIGRFVNNCIRNGSNGLKEHRSFIGPSSFTGPKAIVNSFQDARSRVCVMSEAGLLMKVKSGNVEGKTSYILNSYSKSSRNAYSDNIEFSSKDDSVPGLQAIAMTIISESTEEQLMDAYRDSGALDSGYLPRQSVYKINKRQIDMNMDATDVLPKKVSAKLGELMNLCSTVQAEDDPNPIELHFSEDTYDEVKSYIRKYNMMVAEYEHSDKVKYVMATRIAAKVVRFAGLCAVFNDKLVNGGMFISKESWRWACRLGDYEYEKVTNALSGLAGNDELDRAIVAVYMKMASIIDDSIGNSKCKVNKQYRERKLITVSTLKLACTKLSAVNKLTDKYGTGLDKALNYMKNEGAISIKTSDPLGGKSRKLVQVNDGMVDFISAYGFTS